MTFRTARRLNDYHSSARSVAIVSTTPVVLCLPTADRRNSFEFYRDGLGFKPLGELADDGLPEPLQFVVNDGVRIMLIPTGGFGWITGDHDVAPVGSSECVVSIGAASDAGVDEVVERARRAGAEIVTEPGQQAWGYAGAFADPDGHVWMVTTEVLLS
jgi:predicted lactoylglutathione lyase